MIRTWTLIITRHEGKLAPTLALALLLASLLALGGTQTGHAQDWSPPRTVYFPETGHTLDQLFLDAWREAGGAASYGYPITPEITRDDGSIVQYLQYARFEHHTDGTFALGTPVRIVP